MTQQSPPRRPAQHAVLWIALMVVMLCTTIVLFQQSQGIDRAQHYQFLSQIRQTQQLQTNLKLDILTTRFSLNDNYDRLTLHSEQLRLSLQQLQQTTPQLVPPGQSAIHSQLAQIAQNTEQQAQLVERYKSRNAIFQNSLRYFPQGIELAQAQLKQLPSSHTLTQDLQQLLTTTLRHNLTPNVTFEREIRQQLDRLNAQQSQIPADVQADIQHLVMHGESILQFRQEVTELITEILELPLPEQLDTFAETYTVFQGRVFFQMQLYLWLSYGNTALLLGLGLFFYRMRYRTSILERANQNLEQTVATRTQALETTLQDLQASQAQLIQSEKMSSLGQLVAGIAHELNNPASFIYGNAKHAIDYTDDLLALIHRYQQAYPQPSAALVDYLEDIEWEFTQRDLPEALKSMEAGAERIRALVLSLRNFSRLDEVDKKWTDLHAGIESTLLLLQHRLQRNQSLTIEVQRQFEPLPLVWCYPAEINQVLMHILSNAIEAIEEHATSLENSYFTPLIEIRTIVTISTQVSSQQSNSTSCPVTDQLIKIIITDNGSGMSEVTQQKLFEPFFTTKPVGQGTGLGLSIAYQTVVEGHGGSLSCDSILGQGSRFTIELPVNAEASTGERDSSTIAPHPETSTTTYPNIHPDHVQTP